MSEYKSHVISSTTSSTVSGAQLGTSIYPGWGTVIGAAVGAIVGSISGRITGRKAVKAKEYERKAKAIKKDREENAVYNQYLSYMRQARIARAQSIQSSVNAGIGSSSLTSGAVAGLASQVAYGTQYTAEDWRLNSLYNEYLRLANKNANKASEINSYFRMMDSLVSAAGSAISAYNSGTSMPQNGGQYDLTDSQTAFQIAANESPNYSSGFAYGTFTTTPGVYTYGE
jgi:hypothetical protein